MNEYITKEAAIEAVEDTNIELFLSEWKEIEEKINAIPTADVVPASQERTYKHLLCALLEDIQSLETTLNAACCMCTGIECTECNLCHFRDELEAILERAVERKKRLAD